MQPTDRNLWQILNKGRDGGLDAQDLLVTVAAAVLARLADVQDAENAAIALFEDAKAPPPPKSLWAAALASTVEDDFRRACQRAGEKYGFRFDLVRVNRQVFRSLPMILAWADGLMLDTVIGRRAVAAELDALIDGPMARSGVYLGEFVTPPQLRDVMVALARPTWRDHVVDPCCGMGGTLVHAVQAAIASRLVDKQASLAPSRIAATGLELASQPHLVALLRTQMLDADIQVVRRDALDPQPWVAAPSRPLCIIADLPLGSRRPAAISGALGIASRKVDNLLVQRIAADIGSSGRAVVSVTPGLLFSDEDAGLRRELVQRGLVTTVIQLPPGQRKPHTGVHTCLLVLDPVQFDDGVRIVTLQADTDQANLVEAVEKAVFGGPKNPDRVFVSPAELEENGWRMDAPPRPDRNILKVLTTLAASGQGFRVHELGQIATVLGGRTPTELVPFTASRPPETIQICRVTEVSAALATRSEPARTDYQAPSHASPAERIAKAQNVAAPLASLDGHSRDAVVRAGDVLVTTTGQSVRALVASNGLVGMLAGTGVAIVRLSEGWLPEYVVACMGAKVLREHLADQQRGLIPHLPVRMLRRLPFLAISAELQVRVARQVRGVGSDAIELLRHLVAEQFHDPVSRALESAPELVAILDRTVQGAVADRLGSAVRLVANLKWDEAIGAPELREWFKIMHPCAAAASAAIGVGWVTAEVHVAVLTLTRLALRLAYDSLQDERGVVAERARQCTKAMAELTSELEQVCANDVGLMAAYRWADVTTASDDVSVQILALRPGVLRNAELTDPSTGFLVTFPRIDVNTPVEFRLPIPDSLRGGGQDRVTLLWRGESINGGELRGEVSFDLVVQQGPGAGPADLGASPYIAGNPVEDRRKLFGRETLLDELVALLNGPHGAVVLLEGNRRTGPRRQLEFSIDDN